MASNINLANLNLTTLLQKRIMDRYIVLISVSVPKWNFIQMWSGSRAFVYEQIWVSTLKSLGNPWNMTSSLSVASVVTLELHFGMARNHCSIYWIHFPVLVDSLCT